LTQWLIAFGAVRRRDRLYHPPFYFLLPEICVVTLAELLAGFGSRLGELATAVFVIDVLFADPETSFLDMVGQRRGRQRDDQNKQRIQTPSLRARLFEQEKAQRGLGLPRQAPEKCEKN
jgi:hypothetical protein